MFCYEANRIAVGHHAKAVAEALRSLGKRCSVRWVNRQCEESKDVRRTNYYGAFMRWFEALWTAHRPGAESLYEDFCARVEALRLADGACEGDPDEQLARVETEHSDIIRERLRSADTRRLIEETQQAIVEKRRYLAMLMNAEASGREACARRAA